MVVSPGNRDKSERYKISENRYAWVETFLGRFQILVGSPTQEAMEDVVLFVPRPGRIPDLSFNFSALTEEELDAVEQILTTALKWARPVVQRRDKDAKDAWNDGDDSFNRIYRQVPQLVFRKRPEHEHDESVLLGPEGVSPSSGRVEDPDGGVRGSGDGLVEPVSQAGESQDDES